MTRSSSGRRSAGMFGIGFMGALMDRIVYAPAACEPRAPFRDARLQLAASSVK
jgi:hypothetical protein